MSYKPILFFIFIFCIILFGYFYYELFNKYFPINIFIKNILLLIGICGFFFPQIIKEIMEGEDMENIKLFIIKKYKKK
jgi:hypothetical protein